MALNLEGIPFGEYVAGLPESTDPHAGTLLQKVGNEIKELGGNALAKAAEVDGELKYSVSTNSGEVLAGATSGVKFGANQTIKIGEKVRVKALNSVGVTKYRIYPKLSSGSFVELGVNDTYEFIAEVDISPTSLLIQMYIGGLDSTIDCRLELQFVVGGNMQFRLDDLEDDSEKVDENIEILNGRKELDRVQFYTTELGQVYLEESRVTSGKIWIKATNDKWAGRLYVNFNYTNSEFAAALGRTTEVSALGVVGCIAIDSNEVLCIKQDKSVALVNRSALTSNDTTILACLNGKVLMYNSLIFGELAFDKINQIAERLDNPTSPFYFDNQNFLAKQESFCSLFNGTSKCDSFLFFTDPHPARVADWYGELKKHIEVIRKWYSSTPTDFVLCGGDWLQSGDSQSQALSKLGAIKGLMSNTFSKYYHLVGNHDINSQGTAILTKETMGSIWFNNVGGKTYYEFSSNNTRFLALDTWNDKNIDYVHLGDNLVWLAESLLANTAEHVAVLAHIVFMDKDTYTFADLIAGARNIINAFNGRQPTVVRQRTFDFSNATGYVEFVLGGHSHSDMAMTDNGVPYITTINTRGTDGSSTNFDLVLIDYTANKLKFVRIGSGMDREFDLFSATITR